MIRTDSPTKIVIARQPILDRNRAVYGYELLFRDGFDSALQSLVQSDGSRASDLVISNTVLMFGIDALAGSGKALINVTRDVLLSGHVQLLPPDRVIPEILETIAPDREVVAACRELKAAGFQIALDDVGEEDRGALFEVADIIKVDFQCTDAERQHALVKRFGGRGVKMLAEKVEEPGQFNRALDTGYDYFQGYFFARPEMISRTDLPASQLRHLEMLNAINQPALSFEELEGIIKQDVSLTYRLLRYLNSPAFGFRSEIGSIRQALVLLGEKQIRKWATLVSMAAIGEKKPSELLVAALTRARFLETLATRAQRADQSPDLFLLGMFSLLDALMDQPLDRCLQGIRLAEPTLEALLRHSGPHSPMLELATCYEHGTWDAVSQLANGFSLSPAAISEFYLGATRWARETFGAILGTAAAT